MILALLILDGALSLFSEKVAGVEVLERVGLGVAALGGLIVALEALVLIIKFGTGREMVDRERKWFTRVFYIGLVTAGLGFMLLLAFVLIEL